MMWKWWLLGSMLCCALLIAALLTIYEKGMEAGREEVRLAWSKQREADAQLATKLAAQARENERGLQAAADRIRKEKDAEIRRLDAAYDAAVERLRHRPSRPADYVPATTQASDIGPATGCGADALFREDAEVALGIARDADLVRLALLQCHSQYQAAAEASDPPSH